jgi:hypothetical protein
MPTKHPKRPRDPNQLAKLIVDLATGQRLEDRPEPQDQPTAKALAGRLGGLIGGKKRTEKMSPERRRDAAQHAALARWRKST